MPAFPKFIIAGSLTLSLLLTLIACEGNSSDNRELNDNSKDMVSGKSVANLQVFKSPQCGCCGKWVEHMQSAGFSTQVTDTNELDKIKTRYNIPHQYQSCHTAINEEGYIFEGHIPSREVERFLKEKPANAVGLVVPGMPIGSPGMEMGDKVMTYQVLMLMNDGSTRVYSQISELSH